MEWKTIKHTQSSDGKTEIINVQLWIEFENSRWNKKEKSPVIELYYHDYKLESGWWINKEKGEWYIHPPHKFCEIRFIYFQRQPEEKIYSALSHNGAKTPYNEFTLDYCKQKAIEIFTKKVKDVLSNIE